MSAIQPETVLVTRFCRENMKSDYKNFPWPKEGPVSCPDWDPTPECGGGLHGWLNGKGNARVWSHWYSDVMLVVEVLAEDIVHLGGKVKFPKGVVVHCGDRKSVTTYMATRGHTGLVYGHMIVGDGETAEVGDWGEALAGKGGTAIAGKFGTAEAGDQGFARVGCWGVARAGEDGRAQSGLDGRVELALPAPKKQDVC